MTKHSLPSAFLAAAGLLIVPSVRLLAQQAPPTDATAVLAALKDLRLKQQGIMSKEKSSVLAAINAALADPAKAYEQALAAVEQQGSGVNEPARPAEGRPGNRFSEARDVTRAAEARKRLSDQLRDRDFVNGLRLQLLYLSLTWQHGMGIKTKVLLPALLDYTGQVNNAYATLAPLDMFKKALGDSVFVNYFQVGPYIGGLTDWSDHPFDVESIYQASILPEMRKEKDPRLLDYWDSHLQSETARASATQNSLAITKFNHVRRPSLLWGRAEDELALGNGDQAVADMLGLIKANPDHPDFDKWASELEGIVSAKLAPPPGDVTVGPATLVTPTPGVMSSPVPVAR